MSVSKQIDVLVMCYVLYLTSHQALEFILGWLTNGKNDSMTYSFGNYSYKKVKIYTEKGRN